MVSLIIAAAGSGSRFGYERNKLLYPLGGKPLLAYTIERSAASTAIGEILVVVSPKDKEEIQQIVSALQVSVPIRLLEGGKERQDSIWNALQALSDTTDIVLIHDGARPVADKEMYDTLIEAVREKQAVIYAVPVKNTIKKVNSHDEVMETVERQSLRAVQTPQGFKKELLVRAYQYGKEKGLMVTDDASLVEAYGQAVHVLLGSYENRKVTTPEDIVMVEKALGISCVPRVGIGYDVHQLVEGRPLILGGVSIEHEKGLLGHSDADVLVHAIMDALLGAAGLKDIGTYFPDTSEQYRGISSILLLEQVGSILKEKGFAIHNVDAMVMAQRPKIGPHIDRMKENISQALGISLSSLSIKATTTERLGFVGKEEGMAAQAVVSLIGGRE